MRSRDLLKMKINERKKKKSLLALTKIKRSYK